MLALPLTLSDIDRAADILGVKSSRETIPIVTAQLKAALRIGLEALEREHCGAQPRAVLTLVRRRETA